MKYFELGRGKYRRKRWGLARSGASANTVGSVPLSIRDELGYLCLMEDDAGNTCVCGLNANVYYKPNAEFTFDNSFVINDEILKVHYVKDTETQLSIWFEKADGTKVRLTTIQAMVPAKPVEVFNPDNIALTRLYFKTGMYTPLFFQLKSRDVSVYVPKYVISWNVGLTNVPSFYTGSVNDYDFVSGAIDWHGDVLNADPTEEVTSIGDSINQIDSLVGNLQNKYISR